MNKQTVDLVADILSGKLSFVDLATAGKNASDGEAISAAVSAASGLQAMGATISKTVGKFAPPVFYASVADSFLAIGRDLGLLDEESKTDGKLSNETVLGALSTATAGVAILAGATIASPALALGTVATAIVGSAALGVAALAASRNEGDTRIHDAVANLLNQAQSLASQTGVDLQRFFGQIGGGSAGNGIEKFANAMESNPEGLFPNGPNPEDPWFGSQSPDALIDTIRNRFEDAQRQASPIILDLDGNGFAQRTGWLGQGDGLLVWDINGNGSIDNGRELFGDNTLLANGIANDRLWLRAA